MSKEKDFDFEQDIPNSNDPKTNETNETNEPMDMANNASVDSLTENETFSIDDEQIDANQDIEKNRSRITLLFNVIIGVVILGACYFAYVTLFPSKPAVKQQTNKLHDLGFKEPAQHAFPEHADTLTKKTLPAKIMIKPATVSHLKHDHNTANKMPATAPSSTLNNANASYLMTKAKLKSLKADLTKALNTHNQALTKQLNSIEKQQVVLAENTINEDKTLQAEVNRLNGNLANISQKMNHYTSTLNDVKQSLAVTSRQLQVVIAQQANHAQKLNLRAVVQGRAWLVDGDGKTITVAKGDLIPYYGKVVSINADNDQVVMSSGYTFS